jgi:hypothetical protein
MHHTINASAFVMNVVITVGKVSALNAGRVLERQTCIWPHIWWLITVNQLLESLIADYQLH